MKAEGLVTPLELLPSSRYTSIQGTKVTRSLYNNKERSTLSSYFRTPEHVGFLNLQFTVKRK